MLMRLLKLVEKKKDKIDRVEQSYFISDKTTPSVCGANPAHLKQDYWDVLLNQLYRRLVFPKCRRRKRLKR